jgi:hypothetical protein
MELEIAARTKCLTRRSRAGRIPVFAIALQLLRDRREVPTGEWVFCRYVGDAARAMVGADAGKSFRPGIPDAPHRIHSIYGDRMKPSTAFVLAGVTLALAACNNPDQNRTTSTPHGVTSPTALTEPLVTRSAPAAPAERGPIPPNANAQAPGTNASVAFAQPTEQLASAAPPSKGGPPESQAEHVKAQEAAAAAANTAAADAAKKSGTTGGSQTSPTASDTSTNNPRHGALTRQQESTEMPKAGQANNYSSPALEKSSGRPSDGSTPAQ